MFLWKNKKKLSHNYHQILLLNKFSDISLAQLVVYLTVDPVDKVGISAWPLTLCGDYEFTVTVSLPLSLDQEGQLSVAGIKKHTSSGQSLRGLCQPRKSVNRLTDCLDTSLTLVLLNTDIPCLCKQCRSRSVGLWRSQLIWICTVCH